MINTVRVLDHTGTRIPIDRAIQEHIDIWQKKFSNISEDINNENGFMILRQNGAGYTCEIADVSQELQHKALFLNSED